MAANAHAAVELGIDVLESNGYALLKGKRVGLVTNQTGIDSRGVRTRVLLKKNVNLVALYTPEHGLDGTERAGRFENLIAATSRGKREMFFKCYGSTSIQSEFARGNGPGAIVTGWADDVVRFKGERSQYLLS